MTVIIRRSPSLALTVVEPLYRPARFLDDVENMARELWESWEPFTFHTSLTPRMDITEEKDTLVTRAELPGIGKENLDINLKGDMLTIKAEKKQEIASGASVTIIAPYGFHSMLMLISSQPPLKTAFWR